MTFLKSDIPKQVRSNSTYYPPKISKIGSVEAEEVTITIERRNDYITLSIDPGESWVFEGDPGSPKDLDLTAQEAEELACLLTGAIFDK